MKMTSRHFAIPVFQAAVRWLRTLFFIILFSPAFSVAAAQATHVPWSGYWWPYIHGGLGTGADYRGRPAPIEKFNLLTNGVTSGQALTEYLNAYYDPSAPTWYGLCLYWARAACYEHMDILPSSEENIIFRVGDKKGLLALSHYNDIVENDNGAYPESFHYWLLHYVGDQKKAFVADLWAGTEVWSYPIYRYNMSASDNGLTRSVTTTIFFADDFVHPDYMGTVERSSTYTYDLFLDGTGAITGGQWTGNSVNDHPEIMNIPLGVRGNFPGLDYQKIVQVAQSRDDFLEQGAQAVSIGPGTYQLILLDEDVYTIPARAGDVFRLGIEKQKGSAQDMEVVVRDGNGGEVRRLTVSEDEPLADQFAAETPPYTVSLTQAGYAEDPNIYTLTVDLKKNFNQDIPYIPKSGDWSGFALTNPADAAVEDVMLTCADAEGLPVQTVLGPLRLEAGEKRLFFFSDLDLPLHELIKAERLTLMADGPVGFVNLIGADNDFLAAFGQDEVTGCRLIIPETAAFMTPGVKMFGGVKNETFEDARVKLGLYAADGRLIKETTETIASRRYLPLKPGFSPFSEMPATGWIDVQAGEQSVLSGFHYLSNAGGVEALFALPLRDAVRKIVPHVARQGYWITGLTLINPADEQNRVLLHPALAGADATGDHQIVLGPREKRSLEIQDLFAKPAGDPLYHSIVEVLSQFPLVGYYTYRVPGRTDYAAYPLLDESDFKSALHLPHGTVNNAWWTGVVVCNPLTVAQTVRVEPYGQDGRLMEGLARNLDLNAGAYEVSDLRTWFGQSAADIAFINFRTENEAGAIGGFYLYGNTWYKNILSGSNM